MKKLLTLILAFVITLSLGASIAMADGKKTLALGDEFPDFTAETTDGTFTLSETLKEKEAVMLILWATWCGPCEREFPFIQKVYEELGDKVAVVALSTEPNDTMDLIREYQESHGLSFPMGRDEQGFFGMTGEAGIPVPIMIDRFGRIGYMHAGTLPSEEHAFNLVRAFLGDGYGKSITLTEVPHGQSEISYPSDEELSAALNAENGTLEFTSDPNGIDWPLVPETVDGRTAAAASNGNDELTKSCVHLRIKAASGDALAFDYKVDSVFGGNIEILDNGELVKSFTGTGGWAAWAIALEEGDHDIELSFVNEVNAAFNLGEKERVAAFSNVRLLSGDEAREVLDALPVYPVSEKTGFEILNEGTKKIVISLSVGGQALDDVLPMILGGDAYVIPDGSVKVRIFADASVDPDSAVLFTEKAGEAKVLSSYLNADGTAYEYETEFSGDSTAQVPYVTLLTQDYQTAGYPSIYCLPDEESAANFVDFLKALIGGEVEIRFEPVSAAPAAEASGAETGEAADEEPAEAGAAGTETGEAEYQITVVDQNGDPVPEAVVNVCTDTTCTVSVSDENGVIAFTGEKQNYHLQVIQVPEGYSMVNGSDFYSEDETQLTIEVAKDSVE